QGAVGRAAALAAAGAGAGGRLRRHGGAGGAVLAPVRGADQPPETLFPVSTQRGRRETSFGERACRFVRRWASETRRWCPPPRRRPRSLPSLDLLGSHRRPGCPGAARRRAAAVSGAHLA